MFQALTHFVLLLLFKFKLIRETLLQWPQQLIGSSQICLSSSLGPQSRFETYPQVIYFSLICGVHACSIRTLQESWILSTYPEIFWSTQNIRESQIPFHIILDQVFLLISRRRLARLLSATRQYSLLVLFVAVLGQIKPHMSLNSQQQGKEGAPVTLRCHVSGVPPPIIQV